MGRIEEMGIDAYMITNSFANIITYTGINNFF